MKITGAGELAGEEEATPNEGEATTNEEAATGAGDSPSGAGAEDDRHTTTSGIPEGEVLKDNNNREVKKEEAPTIGKITPQLATGAGQKDNLKRYAVHLPIW